MLFLLRKIRNQMIQKNKVINYLLYSIGEIVLVVVGILIALQINNWNEGKAIQKESLRTLKQLQEEILEKKEETASAAEYINSRLQKRLSYLNTPKENISDSAKILEINNFLTFYTEAIKLPIVESELGPNKKIIQWPALSNSMQDLKTAIEGYNKGLEYIENDMHGSILPFVVKEGVMVDLLTINGMLESRSYVNAAVYDSQELRNVIASNTFMNSSLLEVAKKIITHYDELLEIIEKRLENI